MSRVTSMVVTGTLAASLAACGSGDSNSSTGSDSPSSTGAAAAGTTSKKPVKIAYLAIGTGNSFVTASLAGAHAQAKKMGATLDILDGKFDVATQLAQCQTVANSGRYQAVVVFPVSGPALKPCGPIMKAAKLPLIAEDQPITDSTSDATPKTPGVLANVGQTVDALSQNMVKSLLMACAKLDPCNIAWFRTTSTLPQQDASVNKLLTAALKQNPNMHIVAQADTQLTVQGGFQQAQAFAQRTRDFNVLFTVPAQAAVGAIKGLEQGGMTPGTTGKDVRIVSNGGSVSEIKAVRDGKFYSTLVLRPQDEGAESVKLAVNAARGQTVPATSNPMATADVPIIFTKAVADAHPTFAGQWHE